jgi:uncharacterized protein YycO
VSNTIIDYRTERDTIDDGDVLLFQGTGLFSRLIRFVTRSTYSHSGLAIWWNDRLMVLESTTPEVRIMPLSILIGHYPRVDLYRPTKQLNRVQMFDAATEALGKKYAVWTVVRYVRRILFKIRGGGDPRKPPDKFICSQLVSFAYREGGLDLNPNDSDEFTTPEDISKSESMILVGTLR